MNDAEYERYSVLAEVAELYFLKGKQQAEIAASMKISRSLVSRMISEAQEKGIVSITVNHFFERNTELEQDIRKRFNTGAAVMKLPRDLDVGELRKQIGRFAAGFIYDKLEDSFKVGFTFGTCLKETVDAISLKPPKNVTAVQLTGSLGATESAFDSHELVQKLSSVWNCGSVFLHAPYLVNSEEIKHHLFSSRSNRINAEACRELDIAVVGLSSFFSKNNSALYNGGHISSSDMKTMRNAGIIGDVGSLSINKDGRLVEVESLTRMMALDEKGWKAVRYRCGIAFGQPKIDVIRAALAGGWLTTIITDEQTANLL